MLVNKVAQSGLLVLDLEDFYPEQAVLTLDISEFLFRGLLLKEKEFRAALKEHDWDQYKGQPTAVWCSTDAIVPQWAYMLVTSYMLPAGAEPFFGSPAEVEEQLLIRNLNKLNIEKYKEERVIIKGCGKLQKSGRAYVEITRMLQPVVRSLMFGEACSTVPIYKKK